MIDGTEAVTEDAFLDGRLQIKQFARGFRAGLDSVLLAAACPAGSGDAILDAGCGAGVGLLCVAARIPEATLTGIEIDPGTAALARSNAEANGYANRCHIVTGDLTGSWTALEPLGLKRDFYSHAIANPPFYATGRNREPGSERKSLARSMAVDGLVLWLTFLAASVKPGGTTTLIHTVDMLPELLNAMQGRFGALIVTPIYAKAKTAAIRVLVQGRKGSRAPLKISPPVVMHDDDGQPTALAREVLRNGGALTVG